MSTGKAHSLALFFRFRYTCHKEEKKSPPFHLAFTQGGYTKSRKTAGETRPPRRTDGMYHLLVVDDEAKIRMLIRKYAEFEGHTVTEAENGMEAVELCRKTPNNST